MTTSVAVRVRLKCVGRTHVVAYRVVVVGSHKKCDGRVIGELGICGPQPNPSKIRIDSGRAQYWLGMGAQPSNQIHNLLALTGDIAEFNDKTDAISCVEVPETDKAATVAKAVKTTEAEAEESKTGKAAAEAEEEAKVVAEALTEEATEAGEEV